MSSAWHRVHGVCSKNGFGTVVKTGVAVASFSGDLGGIDLSVYLKTLKFKPTYLGKTKKD